MCDEDLFAPQRDGLADLADVVVPDIRAAGSAGWLSSACPTSMEAMFSPPEMITSFERSRSSM